VKLWKCWNCTDDRGNPGKDFAGTEPVCPGCGLDARTPDGKDAVVARATIHLDPPHPVRRNKGTGKRACDGKPVGTGMASGVPDAVTCPACRATAAYRAAADEFGDGATPAEADYPVAEGHAAG
jgi:hypothetical protein